MQLFRRRSGSGGGRTVGVAGAAVRLHGQTFHGGRTLASYRKMPARRERSTQYSGRREDSEERTRGKADATSAAIPGYLCVQSSPVHAVAVELDFVQPSRARPAPYRRARLVAAGSIQADRRRRRVRGALSVAPCRKPAGVSASGHGPLYARVGCGGPRSP